MPHLGDHIKEGRKALTWSFEDDELVRERTCEPAGYPHQVSCPSNSSTNRRLAVVSAAELEAALDRAADTLVEELPCVPPTPTPACLRSPLDHALVSFYGFGHLVSTSAHAVGTAVGCTALFCFGAVAWPFVYAYVHGREKMGCPLDQPAFLTPNLAQFWIRNGGTAGLFASFFWALKIIFSTFLF